MALVTRCPNCSALYRVGAEQLKSRSGMVRCGACRHVFNAIGCLDYLRPNHRQAEVPLPQTGSAKVEPRADRRPAPPAAALPAKPAHRPTASSAAKTAPTRPRPGARTLSPPPTFDRSQSGSDVDSPSADPGLGALTVMGPISESARESLPDSEFDRLFAPPERTPARRRQDDNAAEKPERHDASSTEIEPTFLRTGKRWSSRTERIAVVVGCAVLAPVLIVQLALLFRASLIVHLPQLQPVLAAVCVPLSCTAHWPMRPELLAVVSSELQAVPGTEAMELDTTIRNRADFPVALPAIELTLTDSLNHPVARKVFAPADYLAARTEPVEGASQSLAAGADLSVRLLFELHGISVAGFVAYPFYP